MSTTDDVKQLNDILYSGLSNDIMGPITVILHAAEHLEKRFCDQPELLDVIYAINDSGNYLARLGTQLVELAACFSGGNLSSLKPVDLQAQLCSLLEETAPYALRRGVTLCWKPDEMPKLYPDCDPVMLDNILLKLLSNAIRYSRPGGTIRVGVTPAKEKGFPARICIEDDGPGVPQEILSVLFPQQPSGKEREFSSAAAGLGLYLACEFCRALGWKLRIEKPEAGGTVAVIELCGSGQDLSGAVPFGSGGEAARIVFRYEQRDRVRLEMAPLAGRLPEQPKTD